MSAFESRSDIVWKFWKCSIKQDYSRFNFKDSFLYFEEPLKLRLGKFGLLSFDDFLVGKDMFNDAHARKNYRYCKQAFLETKEYIELISIYDDLLLAKEDKLCKSDMVILFDRTIHAQHESGMVYEDVDIQSLRKEFEGKHKAL